MRKLVTPLKLSCYLSPHSLGVSTWTWRLTKRKGGIQPKDYIEEKDLNHSPPTYLCINTTPASLLLPKKET